MKNVSIWSPGKGPMIALYILSVLAIVMIVPWWLLLLIALVGVGFFFFAQKKTGRKDVSDRQDPYSDGVGSYSNPGSDAPMNYDHPPAPPVTPSSYGNYPVTPPAGDERFDNYRNDDN